MQVIMQNQADADRWSAIAPDTHKTNEHKVAAQGVIGINNFPGQLYFPPQWSQEHQILRARKHKVDEWEHNNTKISNQNSHYNLAIQ